MQTLISNSCSRPWVHSLRWVLPALLLATAGCSVLTRGPDDNLFTRNSRTEPVRLQIHNDNFNDARIYALWGTQRQRIGMVTGKTSEILEFAWRPVDLRIEVDFIAAGSFTTDVLLISPGELLYLQILPN